MTGVDRVEHAWARYLSSLPDPAFGLVRTRLGFVLLDREGVAGVGRRAESCLPESPPDLLGSLAWPFDRPRAIAETMLRRDAVARVPRWEIGRLLRILPDGFRYLNMGHANLDPRVMRAVHRRKGRIAVLLHDVIPLDHPALTRSGTAPAFGRKLRAIVDHADLVIHTADATRRANEARMARFGPVPQGVTAHLGVPDAVPASACDLIPKGPYFVALGTIEPRKNHALLFDLWATMHERLPEGRIPHLHIVGQRGWASAPLLHRLDVEPFMRRTVFEHPGLDDTAVAALLSGARGLLFPSLAEGYGFPPLEAARAGVPVICSPLPVLRDLLGDYPLYADPSDPEAWMTAILTLAEADYRGARTPPVLPAWDEHFNAVLSLI